MTATTVTEFMASSSRKALALLPKLLKKKVLRSPREADRDRNFWFCTWRPLTAQVTAGIGFLSKRQLYQQAAVGAGFLEVWAGSQQGRGIRLGSLPLARR